MSDFNKAIGEFEKLAQQLFVEESKSYTAGLLAPRFKAAAENNRQDLTINQAAFVLEKVAETNPSQQVTAEDLQDLKAKFYTPTTNFDTEFADLFDKDNTTTAQEVQSRIESQGEARDIEWDGAHEVETADIYSENSDITQIIDPSLNIYDKKEVELVQYAAQLIDEELRSTGKVSKVSSILKVATPQMLIFQTSLRTASSESDVNVFIPVEFSQEAPLFPQVMSTTEQVYQINSDGLDQLTADVNSKILEKRAQSITGLRSAEDYEIALRNDNMKYDEVVDEYELDAPTQVSLGHDEIEQVLQNAVLTTDSQYSKETIDNGRTLVENELSDLGFSNSQVSFNGDYDHGLTYQASVNTEVGKLKIKIAVERNKQLLLPPTQFSVAGDSQVHLLNKQAVNQVARTAGKLEQQVHPLLFAMSYPELKKQLKSAAVNKQPKLAQDIITLIDEKFGDHYRNTATDDYQTWLEESITSYASRCGDCNYYIPKTSQAKVDHCDLVKTAAKNVQKDDETEICTKSTYADLENTSVMFDNGQSIKINWDE